MSAHRMIVTESGLADVCVRLRSAGAFALDMEFQRETTYYSRLQLIQVAVDADVILIDPLAIDRLDVFFETVVDPSVQTVVHAGDQDFEIVYHASGLVPRNVFDTQIAAALVGYGESPGYGPLVRRVLGVELTKLETGTDWARRPLSDAQLAYAAEDVLHLLELRDRLTKRLEQLGRTTWAQEEMAHYGREETYRRDPSTLYTRVKRSGRLNRKELAVLRELAKWREQEAARRDRPRGRVISDEMLVEIARRAPSTPAELRLLRTLPRREVERSGDAIVAAVALGRALPPSEWPRVAPARHDDPNLSVTVDVLDMILRMRAVDAEVAPSYVGTRGDLADLLDHLRGRRADDEPLPALLTGWRRELAGDALVAAASGRASLSIDPETRRVRLDEHPDA